MKNIFEEVAKKYGVTAEDVKNEINSGIRVAMANPDPEVRKIWNKIAPDGKEPTEEELIYWIVKRIHNGE